MARSNALFVATGLLVLAVAAAFVAWWWSPALPTWLPVGLVGPHPTAALDSEPAVPVTTAAQAVPTPVPTPTVVAAANCAPGERPRFQLGFATLNQRLPGVMGEPVECEHPEAETGDTVQATTKGLAVFEKATGRLRFTDGYNHWALEGDSVKTWAGDEPTTAVAGAQAERAKVVNTDGLGVRLRREASSTGATVGAVMEGAEVIVLERSADFARVRADGNREGWVPTRYLQSE